MLFVFKNNFLNDGFFLKIIKTYRTYRLLVHKNTKKKRVEHYGIIDSIANFRF